MRMFHLSHVFLIRMVKRCMFDLLIEGSNMHPLHVSQKQMLQVLQVLHPHWDASNRVAPCSIFEQMSYE